jgi:LysM repeat protein
MKASNAGPERYVLAVALLVPLLVASVAAAQLAAPGLAAPIGLLSAGPGGPEVVSHRPVSSRPEPPPTLVPPTPTVRPTATPVPPTPTPEKNRTYTVQQGDELKNIAAQYHVSIWKIIDTNTIPDPDSLKVGQVLKIPDE